MGAGRGLVITLYSLPSSVSASAEYEGIVPVGRRVFQSLLADAPTPERCLEAYYFHRTRLELIAERKVRRRSMTDAGNVEITGRDLRAEVPGRRISFNRVA